MKKRWCVFSILILAFSVALSQPTQNLLDPRTRDVLRESLSGELAKEHVIQITRHHRIQGSRGYRAAAEYVLQQLRNFGFSEKDAYIESFKSDGKAVYQTWQSPSGWDISWGELRMLQPYEERIVGYPEIAMSVVTYSNPGDVTAELVWVGNGTSDNDYTGKDVAGKIVLATGYGGSVHRLAVLKFNARAVVCYLDDERAKDHPDMLAYTGMWPRTDELERVTFGFNLSHRQGEKLRDLLLSGKKVIVRGQVRGVGLEPFYMDVVVAHLRGGEKAQEELVLSAHLDHPKESANDNASGSAAILDIARTLRQLTDSGRLPKLKRSLRFVWIPEWNGMMPYIDAHPEMVGPELGGTFLANLNLDMVGENQELLHSMMILTRTPTSIPSVLNDVIENMAQMVDGMNIRTARGSQSQFNYRVTPYSGGSDHMMFIDRKIPGMMIGHGPDYTHHTSDDTPDKVDPVELERSELIASGTVFYLSNLDDAQAADLIQLSAANAAKRIGDASRIGSGFVRDAPEDRLPEALHDALITIGESGRVCSQALGTIVWYNDGKGTRKAVEEMQNRVADDIRFVSDQLIRSAASRNGGKSVTLPGGSSDKRVPVRLTRGPLDFGLPESKLSREDAAKAQAQFQLNGDIRFEAVNFIDGKRSVAEIEKALVAEFGRQSFKGLGRFIETLVQVGVVQWK